MTGPPTTIGASGNWSYFTAPLTAVNGWIKGTTPNYGFQLKTDTIPSQPSAYGFTTTEGNQAYWPALEVTWKPDTTPPSAVTRSPGPASSDKSYVSGAQTVSITASAQDGESGISKFELRRDGSTLVSTAAVSCPRTVCPLSATGVLNLATNGLTEGAHTLSIRAIDGAGNIKSTAPWTIYVDRTAPARASGLEATVDESDASSVVDFLWEPSSDPALQDGSSPSALRDYAVQLRIGTGAWGAESRVGLDADLSVPLGSVAVGTTVEYRVTATDNVGNAALVTGQVAVALPTLTVSQEGQSDPLVDTPDLTPAPTTDWDNFNGDGPNSSTTVSASSSSSAASSGAYGFSALGTVDFAHQLCDGGPSPCGQYVGRLAAAHAREYWNSNHCYEWKETEKKHCSAQAGFRHEFRDPDYYYYGNDCTNFVSQVLHFGGMRFERTAPGINDPRHEEKYYTRGTDSRWSQRTVTSTSPDEFAYQATESFYNVNKLYSQLLNNGLARKPGSNERWRAGDLIFYRWSGPITDGAKLSHVVVVARVKQQRVYIASHTTDRYGTFKNFNDIVRGDPETQNAGRIVIRPERTRFDIG